MNNSQRLPKVSTSLADVAVCCAKSAPVWGGGRRGRRADKLTRCNFRFFINTDARRELWASGVCSAKTLKLIFSVAKRFLFPRFGSDASVGYFRSLGLNLVCTKLWVVAVAVAVLQGNKMIQRQEGKCFIRQSCGSIKTLKKKKKNSKASIQNWASTHFHGSVSSLIPPAEAAVKPSPTLLLWRSRKKTPSL